MMCRELIKDYLSRHPEAASLANFADDSDSYGEGHWLTDQHEPIIVSALTEEKSPQVATVEFEDLGESDDLSHGATFKILKDIGDKVSKRSSYGFDIEHDDDGCIVSVDSFCKHGNASDDCGGIWQIFRVAGLTLLNSTTHYAASKNSYFRQVQKFKVNVHATCKAPFIQLICKAKEARHMGSWFREGDIITAYARNNITPFMFPIVPKKEQTFVPLSPGQRLQIIIDSEQSELQWNSYPNSSLMYLYSEDVIPERSYKIGKKVVCHEYECVRRTEPQEIFFVNYKDGTTKTICVPSAKKNYPYLIDPVKTSVICASDPNLNGFILRTRQKSEVTVEKHCPLKPIYSLESSDFSEIKFMLTKSVPLFVLEKRSTNQWLARLN